MVRPIKAHTVPKRTLQVFFWGPSGRQLHRLFKEFKESGAIRETSMSERIIDLIYLDLKTYATTGKALDLEIIEPESKIDISLTLGKLGKNVVEKLLTPLASLVKRFFGVLESDTNIPSARLEAIASNEPATEKELTQIAAALDLSLNELRSNIAPTSISSGTLSPLALRVKSHFTELEQNTKIESERLQQIADGAIPTNKELTQIAAGLEISVDELQQNVNSNLIGGYSGNSV